MKIDTKIRADRSDGYLRDATGNRRFWSMSKREPRSTPTTASLSARSHPTSDEHRLMEAAAGRWIFSASLTEGMSR